MHAGIQEIYLGVSLDIARSDFTFTGRFNVNSLRTVSIQLCSQTLDAQDDLSDILLYTRDRGQLVVYAVNLYRIDCNTGQGGEQNSSEAVAERNAVATLQRSQNEFTVFPVTSQFDSVNFRLLYFFQHINPPISQSLLFLWGFCNVRQQYENDYLEYSSTIR